MSVHTGDILVDMRGRKTLAAIATSIVFLAATTVAWPQQPQPQTSGGAFGSGSSAG